MSDHLRALFPGLRTTPFVVRCDADPACNCIAWAANDTGVKWWPVGDGPGIFWPPGVPCEESLEAFAAAFATLGYAAGGDDFLEPGVQKIALFTNAFGVPTHAARQLESGQWSSKIGELEAIEHQLRALEGDIYGTVALILKRPRKPGSI